MLAWTQSVPKGNIVGPSYGILKLHCQLCFVVYSLSLLYLYLLIFLSRMHFHGIFADPLGWMKRSSFTVQQFISEDILALLTPTQLSKPAVLVIDSLSWLLRHHDPVVICRRLQDIKRGMNSLALFCHLGHLQHLNSESHN